MFRYSAASCVDGSLLSGGSTLVSEEHSNAIHSCNNKLMKGKALRKHSLHEKTAASVLLKLFVSSNE